MRHMSRHSLMGQSPLLAIIADLAPSLPAARTYILSPHISKTPSRRGAPTPSPHRLHFGLTLLSSRSAFFSSLDPHPLLPAPHVPYKNQTDPFPSPNLPPSALSIDVSSLLHTTFIEKEPPLLKPLFRPVNMSRSRSFPKSSRCISLVLFYRSCSKQYPCHIFFCMFSYRYPFFMRHASCLPSFFYVTHAPSAVCSIKLSNLLQHPQGLSRPYSMTVYHQHWSFPMP